MSVRLILMVRSPQMCSPSSTVGEAPGVCSLGPPQEDDLLPPPFSLLPQCLGALPAPHPPFPGPLVGPWGISCRTRVHRSTPRRQSHGGLGSSCTQPGSWTPGSWEIGPQCLSWNKGAPPGGSSVGPQEQAPDSSPAPMPEMPDVTAPSSPESAARDCSPLGQRVPWGHCRSPCARAHLG